MNLSRKKLFDVHIGSFKWPSGMEWWKTKVLGSGGISLNLLELYGYIYVFPIKMHYSTNNLYYFPFCSFIQNEIKLRRKLPWIIDNKLSIKMLSIVKSVYCRYPENDKAKILHTALIMKIRPCFEVNLVIPLCDGL